MSLFIGAHTGARGDMTSQQTGDRPSRVHRDKRLRGTLRGRSRSIPSRDMDTPNGARRARQHFRSLGDSAHRMRRQRAVQLVQVNASDEHLDVRVQREQKRYRFVRLHAILGSSIESNVFQRAVGKRTTRRGREPEFQPFDPSTSDDERLGAAGARLQPRESAALSRPERGGRWFRDVAGHGAHGFGHQANLAQRTSRVQAGPTVSDTITCHRT